eukprot:TRINITY_DN9294_c0_g1_i3.p1 TRINITY_DN9294_c0_g1~~TRINITY_DN9294_c0_g1_i3.p1  ORF type:complete len:210 (+),score=10.89 TRINITY_DN9294_c0_g1_i3:143-772(+)
MSQSQRIHSPQHPHLLELPLISILHEESKRFSDAETLCIRIYCYFVIVLSIVIGISVVALFGQYAPPTIFIMSLGPLVVYIIGILCLDYGIRTRNGEALNMAYWIILISYIGAIVPFLLILIAMFITGQSGIYANLIYVVDVSVMVIATFNTIILLTAASKYRTTHQLLRNLEHIYVQSFMSQGLKQCPPFKLRVHTRKPASQVLSKFS